MMIDCFLQCLFAIDPLMCGMCTDLNICYHCLASRLRLTEVISAFTAAVPAVSGDPSVQQGGEGVHKERYSKIATGSPV